MNQTGVNSTGPRPGVITNIPSVYLVPTQPVIPNSSSQRMFPIRIVQPTPAAPSDIQPQLKTINDNIKSVFNLIMGLTSRMERMEQKLAPVIEFVMQEQDLNRLSTPEQSRPKEGPEDEDEEEFTIKIEKTHSTESHNTEPDSPPVEETQNEIFTPDPPEEANSVQNIAVSLCQQASKQNLQNPQNPQEKVTTIITLEPEPKTDDPTSQSEAAPMDYEDHIKVSLAVLDNPRSPKIQRPNPLKMGVNVKIQGKTNEVRFRVRSRRDFEAKNKIIASNPRDRRILKALFKSGKEYKKVSFYDWFTEYFLNEMTWECTNYPHLNLNGTPIFDCLREAWETEDFRLAEFVRLELLTLKAKERIEIIKQ